MTRSTRGTACSRSRATRFTVADAATDTGRRIAFDPASMPVNKDGVAVDPAEWNRNDGFSPGQAISVHVPGLDLATSEIPTLTDIEASLADDAPIVLLDATTGERHPYFAELDATVTTDDAARALHPPGSELSRRAPHAWSRCATLRDAGGTAIAPTSQVFVAYRDRLDTGVDAVEARRERYEQVFADLDAAGVAREDLYLAWDFTVASERNLTERMLHIRDDAFAQLGDAAPAFTVDTVEENARTAICCGA